MARVKAKRIAAAPVLELRGVSKRYGRALVLDKIDLTLAEHEVVCLIGASGSGKSTLLRCADLLEPIDAGSIALDGRAVSADDRDADETRRQLGIVFQGFSLFPHLTALENVALAPRVALGLTPTAAEKRARALLKQLGLAAKANAYPDSLSGGQQQRVAIARALATEPKVLLLDEITSALDPVLVADVLEALRALAKGGATMLIATHEMAFAADVADRICYLEGGRIIEQGSPEKIFGAPRDARTRAFLKRVRSVGASALR
ncbi:MAG: amino acid ABC transporter ATP-binding protein [bacterium]|nr:amino acid ABC transporter ATP-binding protein [Candidatus Aquidulcis frankliniae]